MRDTPAPLLPAPAAFEASWLEYLSAFDERDEQRGESEKAKALARHSALRTQHSTQSSVLHPRS
jgi:hypothetical protein